MSEERAMAGATKHDSTKVKLEFLPYDALEEVTRAIESGNTAYGARDWERGMSYSRLFGAACRHLCVEWWQKRSRSDRDSGRSHLAHAAACILMLLAYELRRIGTDDRP